MARKPSLGTRYGRIKKRLTRSLEEKGIYDDADEILIDEFCFNLKIADDAKADIKERGYQINTVRDPMKKPYFQANPSVSTYLKTCQIMSNILTKLGITPQERMKLSLKPEEIDPLQTIIDQANRMQ